MVLKQFYWLLTKTMVLILVNVLKKLEDLLIVTELKMEIVFNVILIMVFILEHKMVTILFINANIRVIFLIVKPLELYWKITNLLLLHLFNVKFVRVVGRFLQKQLMLMLKIIQQVSLSDKVVSLNIVSNTKIIDVPNVLTILI